MACKTCNKIKHIKSGEEISKPEQNNYDEPNDIRRITSYADITISPDQAPDISVIRDQGFQDTLVEIEAANVIKGFCENENATITTSPDEEGCPSCETDQASEICVNHKAETIDSTQGKQLDFTWKDAIEVKCMTLLGRCGDRLANLVGEGVLYLKKGQVCVTKDIPLRVSKLWHQWILPTPNSSPIIGQPMPFPYQVITDLDGNPHVIQGLADEDSFTVWDHEAGHFYQKPVSDFPTCVREKIASASQLEIVGFEPLGVGDDPSLLRCLKRIEGEGILVFKKQQTAPSEICECESCEATGQQANETTVAEFLPYPTTQLADSCPYLLTFNPATGSPQWTDPSTLTCLKGEKGDQGDQGIQGIQGEKGDQGLTGANSCCD